MANITNVFQNVSSLQDILAVPNTQSGGKFWFAMTILMFIVLVVSFLGYGFQIALLTAGFLMLIIGMFLVYLQLMSWSYLMIYLGVILFTILYVTWDNRRMA